MCSLSGKRLVCISDPDSIEMVLRAEGKYRHRDLHVTDGLNWLTRNRLKHGRLPPVSQE